MFCTLGYQHSHPQLSHCRAWAAPCPHQTPQFLCCPGGHPCRGCWWLSKDRSLFHLLGPTWEYGAGQGAVAPPRGPACCPTMALHFVSPPELFRLQCGWEEAEEWAAPQIVSVLAAPWDGHGGSGCLPTSLPCSPVGGSGWVESSSLPWPRYLPSTRPQAMGGRFLLPLGYRKMGLTSSKNGFNL